METPEIQKTPPPSPRLDGGDLFSQHFLEGIKPDPIFTVSEWSDKYRLLTSRSSAEPGPWRTSRVPYLREVMDCLGATSDVEEIYVLKGSQLGFTEVGNNWLGYVIHHTPGPFLSVQPTLEMAKRNSKQRIDPLIEESEILQARVSRKKAKDAGNSILAKDFQGGMIIMTGANSPAGLRSMPARFVFLDEMDGYPKNAGREGDPVELAKGRTKTFSRRRKIYGPSTPTIKGQSRVEAAYEDSDQREYHIPCPLCGHFQILEWKNLQWKKGHPETVLYYCEKCQKGFPEHFKTVFLAEGKWIPKNPGAKMGKVRGYKINSLYSPFGWYSWAQAAQDWEDIKGDQEKLKTFVNTVLAESWQERGDAPDFIRLYERRELYKIGTIPKGGVLLVAAADIQATRIEVEVKAYGRDRESWSIDYRVFEGDTSNLISTAWQSLEKLLSETFTTHTGQEVSISMLGVDSGYNTQNVYSWVRKFPSNRVVALKGVKHMQMMVQKPKTVDVAVAGRKIRRALLVYNVGVDLIKSELYGFLKQTKGEDEKITAPGFCHFPQYGEEYFKQLTAEHLVTRMVKGRAESSWEKKYERNEVLDCNVYCRAVAAIVGMDRWKEQDWINREKNIGIEKPVERPEKNKTRVTIVKKKSTFW